MDNIENYIESNKFKTDELNSMINNRTKNKSKKPCFKCGSKQEVQVYKIRTNNKSIQLRRLCAECKSKHYTPDKAEKQNTSDTPPKKNVTAHWMYYNSYNLTKYPVERDVF